MQRKPYGDSNTYEVGEWWETVRNTMKGISGLFERKYVMKYRHLGNLHVMDILQKVSNKRIWRNGLWFWVFIFVCIFTPSQIFRRLRWQSEHSHQPVVHHQRCRTIVRWLCSRFLQSIVAERKQLSASNPARNANLCVKKESERDEYHLPFVLHKTDYNEYIYIKGYGDILVNETKYWIKKFVLNLLGDIGEIQYIIYIYI